MDELSGTVQEVIQMLADRINTLTSITAGLTARSEVDSHLLAALAASHPDPNALRRQWRAMSSAALPELYLYNQGSEACDEVRLVAVDRMKFWNEALSAGC